MTSWVLVADLGSLRNEFNVLSPGRDKASDGSIGDTAHAEESSDHNPDETGTTPYEDPDNINEVHAIDVDSDLRKPGWDMQRCVDIIVGRHKNGEDSRLQNVIYNHRIWSRSWGWTAHSYTGTSAHTEHAHFSSRYGSGSTTANPENVVKGWGLLLAEDNAQEDDMPFTEEQLEAAPFKYKTGQRAEGSSYLQDFWSLYQMVKSLGESVTALDTKVDNLIAAQTKQVAKQVVR
jgi:hypothetical protein